MHKQKKQTTILTEINTRSRTIIRHVFIILKFFVFDLKFALWIVPMSTEISDENDIILPVAFPMFHVLWTFSKLPDVPRNSELCVDLFASREIFDSFTFPTRCKAVVDLTRCFSRHR